MEQKHCLDLVFCLDASATAVSLFDGLRDHVCDLLDSLQGGRSAWDVRLDFLAYSTPYDFGEGGKRKRRTDKKHNGWQGMLFQSMRRKNIQLLDALYRPPSGTFAVLKQFVAPAFFTDDVGDFKRALANIEFIGDETPAVALDIAADYPFRPGADCLRVMILLTDEPLESGSAVAKSMGKLADLAKKLQDKRIALYVISPYSRAFDDLAQRDDLFAAIFSNVRPLTSEAIGGNLRRIGGEISSLSPTPDAQDGARPLFNEDSWKEVEDCVCTDLTDAVDFQQRN